MVAKYLSWRTLSYALNPILFYVAYKLYLNHRKNDSNSYVPSEAFMFPDSGIQCPYMETDRGCLSADCPYTHTLQSITRLKNHVKSATRTLDVCVFILESNHLLDILISAHKSGVTVRCITDSKDIPSDVRRIKSHGIPVRFDTSDYLMHHKFIVIDGAKVITGSYNWTKSGMSTSRENVIVLRTQDVVRKYAEEFEALWRGYGQNKTNKTRCSGFTDRFYEGL